MIYENVDGDKLISDANSLSESISSRKSKLNDILSDVNSEDWDAKTVGTIRKAIFILVSVCDRIANYFSYINIVGAKINECKRLVSLIEQKNQEIQNYVQKLTGGRYTSVPPELTKLRNELSSLESQLKQTEERIEKIINVW